jgi:transcriptional regulator with XRE-family HTH domain
MIKKVGEKIRAIRESKDLTQANMAEELGMKNSSSYAKIERGVVNPPLKRLFEIANVLEVSITEFFDDKIIQVKEPKNNYGYATKEELHLLSTTILIEIEKLREEVISKKNPPKKSAKGKK